MGRCNILAAALVALGTMGVAEASAQPSGDHPRGVQTQQDSSGVAARAAGNPPRADRQAVLPEAICAIRFNTLVYYPPAEDAVHTDGKVTLRRTATAARSAVLRPRNIMCKGSLPVQWT